MSIPHVLLDPCLADKDDSEQADNTELRSFLRQGFTPLPVRLVCVCMCVYVCMHAQHRSQGGRTSMGMPEEFLQLPPSHTYIHTYIRTYICTRRHTCRVQHTLQACPQTHIQQRACPEHNHIDIHTHLHAYIHTSTHRKSPTHTPSMPSNAYPTACMS